MSGLQLPSGDDNLGELNRNRPLHPSLYTLSTSQPLFPHSTPHQLTSCETATRPIDNRPRVQAPFVGLVHLSSPLPLLANHHFMSLSPHFAHRTPRLRHPLSLARTQCTCHAPTTLSSCTTLHATSSATMRPPAAYVRFRLFCLAYHLPCFAS